MALNNILNSPTAVNSVWKKETLQPHYLDKVNQYDMIRIFDLLKFITIVQ